MSLTAPERETVISMNDEDDTAHVYSSQRRIITKLKKNPSAKLLREGKHAGSVWAEFEIPYPLISLRGKRVSRAPMTEEHKAKLAAGRAAVA